MKASLFLLASGAALAMAGPLEKRVYKTDTVVEIVYTTVYADEVPAPTSTLHSMWNGGPHKHKKPATTVTPSPKPKPTTSKVKVAPKPKTTEPAPAPVQTYVQQPEPAKTAITGAAPSDFPSTAVYHHNVHRDNHSAPAMSWDDTYAGYAAQSAKSCVFAHDLSPGNGGYGQNIAMYAATGDVESVGASKAVAQAITDMWYNGEIWQFPSNGYGQATPDMGGFEAWGHYSQVIWADSTQLGCAVQYCAPGTMFPNMGAWYTVCNYHPPGNMGGAYGQNVHAPEGKATVNA